jgi:hypothetical protein
MDLMSKKVHGLGVASIIIVVDDEGTETGITSRLDQVMGKEQADGMETLLLALAIDGVNVSAPKFVGSVRKAIQSYQ